jgi:steroid delta-isomerase-like uncharacterized protein
MAKTSVKGSGGLSEDFAREWIDRFLAAWHSHDPPALPALCTEDVQWEDPFIYPNGVAYGKGELQAWLASVFRAFPDVRFEIEGEPFLSLDRARVGAVWRGIARMTGPLDPPGFAATGQQAELVGVDLHSFREGQLAQVLTITDLNAVGRQLGAIPPPGTLRERMVVALQRLSARRMRRRGRSVAVSAAGP